MNNEKNNKKTVEVSVVIFFVSLLVICILEYCVFSLYSKSADKRDEIVELKERIEKLEKEHEKEEKIVDTENMIEIDLPLGRYTINEIYVDKYGVSNVNNGINLKEDNVTTLYLGNGITYVGSYTITGKRLICQYSKAFSEVSKENENNDVNIELSFGIENENLIKLNYVSAENILDNNTLRIGTSFSRH